MKIRRIISLILVCAFLLTGCSVSYEPAKNTESSERTVSESLPSAADVSSDISSDDGDVSDELNIDLTDFSSEDTLRYIDDCIYTDVVNTLDSDAYFVENVETIYYSQEYIDELKFNSLENIYFGYNLSELNDLFQGTKYVFDVDRNNNTIVKKAEVFDDTTGKIIKNVAIGTGVILVCVTVSLATGGAAPAVSAVFMASAKAATIGSLSSGGIGAAVATMTTDFSSQSFDESMKNIALQASEEFKWGAIIGAVAGGTEKAVSLFGEAKQTVFTLSEYAKIQKETKYPIDVIKQFTKTSQIDICKKAGLKAEIVNGKTSLIRKIDLDFIDEKTGLTNLQLMLNGKAPIDPVSKLPYELHHVGQKADSTLAILTQEEHRLGDSYKIWHELTGKSEIDRAAFNKIKKDFWKSIAVMMQ